MLFYILAVLVAILVVVVCRWLRPKPYAGIPYNKESAGRILGDVPLLAPLIAQTKEFSGSITAITTRRLGSPVAQLLFPNIRKPMIVVEDAREIEDIILRRTKEFDKAPTTVDFMLPLFPHGTLSQYTTPELKAQKRLWSDGMTTSFLQKAAAPNIRTATLDLLELWSLKANSVHQDRPFEVIDDFQSMALDTIWAAVVGEPPGIVRYEVNKLQSCVAGKDEVGELEAPRGIFLRDAVAYIANAIATISNSPMPAWASKLETWMPRYRRFRATMSREISTAMANSVNRYQRLEQGMLDSDECDTCMMDLVLRRQVAQAQRAQRPMMDPTKDQSMHDEMLTMLAGGYDSTAAALCWFVRFMETYPDVQTELRSVLRSAFPDTKHPSVQSMLSADIPYLDAVCEECLRLGGVVKANMRQALVDTEILGLPIPKGAELFLNYHINLPPIPVSESKRSRASRAAVVKMGDGLSEKPGQDLDVFEPKRWLVKDEKTGKDKFNPFAIPALPFGGGPRGCFGRKLAVLEFRIVVQLLILNIEFLELPSEYKGHGAVEKVFRGPDKSFVRISVL
ncbi:unnamed protein product [Clonostachys rosea]|uniref:Cytochrome P450 n=1 Tax=Bionectria ochroleuca TaxID=29856 RepID=A0ABY6UXW5_BIOOC|nr:unnamed protein product [Clonostachys rosea]